MTKRFGMHGSLMILALALILAAAVVAPAVAFPLWAIALALFIARYRVTICWRNLLGDFWVNELGAVSVLYFVRGGGVLINGSANGPTASQAQAVYKQSAQVAMGDADTQALFTHSWGLDASAPTYLEPEIFYYQQQITANGTWLTALTFDVTNTNVVKINKPNFAQSGGTWIVTLRRPHSVGQ